MEVHGYCKFGSLRDSVATVYRSWSTGVLTREHSTKGSPALYLTPPCLREMQAPTTGSEIQLGFLVVTVAAGARREPELSWLTVRGHRGRPERGL